MPRKVLNKIRQAHADLIASVQSAKLPDFSEAVAVAKESPVLAGGVAGAGLTLLLGSVGLLDGYYLPGGYLPHDTTALRIGSVLLSGVSGFALGWLFSDRAKVFRAFALGGAAGIATIATVADHGVIGWASASTLSIGCFLAGLVASSTRPTSSTFCRTCSFCAACRAMFVPTMARSSSPRPCGSGSWPSAQRPRSSSRAALGRTAIARASTRSFATNCSTVRSSTASPRPRSSLRHGGATITPSGRTHRSDINRRHQRPLSGLRHHAGQRHHLPRQWPKSPSCIKTETGPPHGVRPAGLG